METLIKTTLFHLKKLNSEDSELFKIDRRAILIGSHPLCELHFMDDSISLYHAFISIQPQGIVLKDLCSASGVYVNGQRIVETIIRAGDSIHFGRHSYVLESIIEEVEASKVMSSPEVKSSGVFIDGEFCDVLFDESNFKPITELPQFKFEGEYQELEETDTAFNLSFEVSESRLEVINYINGMISDVQYLELKNGDFYLSPLKKDERHIFFSSLSHTKFFTIKKGQLRFEPQHEKLIPSTSWDQVDLHQPFFLSVGAEQLSLRLVENTFSWRQIPLFYRDREFYKKSLTIFMILFFPMLLLSIVDIAEIKVEPDKEIAVIYKLPKPPEIPKPDGEKSELSTEVTTSETENTGLKENLQPDNKAEFREASQDKKIIAKSTAPTPKKEAPPVATDVKKVVTEAKAEPTPLAPAVVKTSPVAVKAVKPYAFKSAMVGSLVSDAPSLNAAVSGSGGMVQDKSFNVGNSASGALVTGTNIGVSNLGGFDSRGSGSASFGSRGLANKKGFDSTYLEPSTVVVGSIDPELIRKILREYIPQFRHCYQQELSHTSDKIKGIMDLNFTIGAQGKATKFNVKTKIAKFSPKGVKCVGQVLSYIDFPKPKGGGVVDVRQPLNFLAETKKY